jgi:hypothetical protein
MVFVREASARPTQDGDANCAQGGNDVVADPARVGDLGIFPHPQPIVDAMPKVFRKMPVDIFIDPVFAPVGVEYKQVPLFGMVQHIAAFAGKISIMPRWRGVP